MTAIFKWMIVLLLLLAVAGGGSVYWYYIRSDEMLRTEVLRQLYAMAPTLRVGIERANFDFKNRVRIYGFTVQLPGDLEPMLEIQEMVLTLDQKPLTDFQFENISVERIRLVHPKLRAVRHPDGSWNWQGVKFQSAGSGLLPHFELEHGGVGVEFQSDQAARIVKLVDLNMSVAPASARQVTGTVSTRLEAAGTRIETAGPLSSKFEVNLDSPVFALRVKWGKLPVGDDLLGLLSEISPELAEKLQQARRMMQDLSAKQVASVPIPDRNLTAIPTAGTASTRLQSQVQFPVNVTPTSFGLKFDCDIDLKLQRKNVNDPLWFEVLTEIRSGQLSNPLLPFPLYEMHGSVYADASQVIVRDFRAENGPTQLRLNTRLIPNQLPKGKVQIRNLALDDPLKSRLPETIRKVLQPIFIEGICDVDVGTVERDGETTIEGELRLSKGIASHEKFPYRVRDVNGTVTLRGRDIRIDAIGNGGGVPVRLTGQILNPGPANQSEFVIRANGVVIDDAYLQACPDNFRRAITDLDLQGDHDIKVRVSKPAGIGQRFTTETDLLLNNCSCCFKGFPYRIIKLNGSMHANEGLITFNDLKGMHDATTVTASGTFTRQPPGRLDLTIHAENAAFDRSLELAIPRSVNRVWQEFQPKGQFDTTVKIDWIPGQPCRVSLPEVRVTDAEVTMRSFPWPLHTVRGDFSYEESKLKIHTISARHDDTQIRGKGEAFFAPGEPWRVRFDELHVDDLIPNSTFRDALPPQLQKAFRALNPSGKFSVATSRQETSPPNRQRGGYVELSGADHADSISAAWDLQVILAECALNAGIRVDDIHGRIDLVGLSHQQSVKMNGRLDLDSVSVFRLPSRQAHQIVHVVGPFQYVDGEFIAGSKSMSTPAPTEVEAPLSEQVCGDVIDGKLKLNVHARLHPEADYRVGVKLNQAKLETYAQQYWRGQSNLAGIMNGWLYLWGKGHSAEQLHGRGRLMVQPAALYELPLFVQIFRAFRLDSADRTAFKSASVEYNVENQRFNFERIELLGSTISMRGQGYVRFDGAMQLRFASELPRNRLRIPGWYELTGALGRGWVGTEITGTVGRPDEPRLIPFPELDEAFKQFLGTFDPNPGRPVNQSAAPGIRRSN